MAYYRSYNINGKQVHFRVDAEFFFIVTMKAPDGVQWTAYIEQNFTAGDSPEFNAFFDSIEALRQTMHKYQEVDALQCTFIGVRDASPLEIARNTRKKLLEVDYNTRGIVLNIGGVEK